MFPRGMAGKMEDHPEPHGSQPPLEGTLRGFTGTLHAPRTSTLTLDHPLKCRLCGRGYRRFMPHRRGSSSVVPALAGDSTDGIPPLPTPSSRPYMPSSAAQE